MPTWSLELSSGGFHATATITISVLLTGYTAVRRFPYSRVVTIIAVGPSSQAAVLQTNHQRLGLLAYKAGNEVCALTVQRWVCRTTNYEQFLWLVAWRKSKQAASLLQRETIGSHTILRYFGVWGTFGLFSYFWCKIWHHILARRPTYPTKVKNFAPISFSFRDLTRDRQTTERQQTTDRRDHQNRRLWHSKFNSQSHKI